MDKKGVVRLLEHMGVLLELSGANPFRSRAYYNASRALDATTQPFEQLVAEGRLLEIKGIGRGIAAVIADLATHGTSEEYEALRASFPAGLLELLRIEGLGPKRVKTLYDVLKIGSLDELERAAREEKVAGLAGFGPRTQENILRGIEVVRSRRDRALFRVALSAAEDLLAGIRSLPAVLRAEVAGSIRRRKEVVGNIDIVVAAEKADSGKVLDWVGTHSRAASFVARGDAAITVKLVDGIPCDVRVVAPQEFAFALAYFTGSKEHNAGIRLRARAKGMALNEHGFSPLAGPGTGHADGSVVRCDTEAEIYGALGLAYVPPELREGEGEIEAAAEGSLPVLVEEGDIRGTFHCHTSYSDGLNSIEDMARAAQAQGWEYLGIGDHSKTAAYAGGLTEGKVREQFAEVDALNSRLNGFRVLKGTECDILPDGSLDWSDRLLGEFEYVVASVHSNFKMGETEMTRRIVRAVSHPKVTMLGHPTGRLLLSREPYAVDMTQVISAAADHGVVIEINAHPSRLDLDWRLCRRAREQGVLIAINPDAHSVEELPFVMGGVSIARKGWLRKQDVLNTRSLSGIGSHVRLS